MTIISRITGLVREMVFAYYFGATASMDAFNVAYRIPNFLRNLLAEGAFSQSFVPVLSEYRENHDIHEVKVFLNHIAGLMLSVLLIFTIIMVLLAPFLIYIFAPGFINDPTRFGLTVAMLRITFPYILFISLTAYISGILNTYGKFGISAFTPNLLNLSLIGAAIVIAPYFTEPVQALAWGIFIGGATQLLFQIPYLYKLKLIPHPKISWHDTGVKRVLKLMLPAIFGVSVAQISFLADNLLASFLQVGSISWLNYASRITLFPLGVFGVAISTVVLPYLSRKHITKSKTEFYHTLDWALKFVFVIALPASIGITMLSNPIIITLFSFQSGQFTELDISMVQHSCWGFSVGIPAFILVKVLSSGFYSQQNIKTPVKTASISMLINIVLAICLIFPLKHAGLALATSLTSLLNAGLLFWNIRRNGDYHPSGDWKILWLRLVFANTVLIFFLWYTAFDRIIWINWNSFNRALHLVVICVGAMLIYFSCLRLSGMRLYNFIMYEKDSSSKPKHN